jgi:hypothetical protein
VYLVYLGISIKGNGFALLYVHCLGVLSVFPRVQWLTRGSVQESELSCAML